jgi:GT2 family glycosyltransferase
LSAQVPSAHYFVDRTRNDGERFDTSGPMVYVVMLTWNQRDDTLECLASLYQMTYQSFRIVLVDNASTDGTREAVLARFPQVETLSNSTNHGFAAAANQGIAHALQHGADYVLLLNNDTVVEKSAVEQLVRCAEDNAVGMVIPKIYYHSQPQTIWSVGAELNRWTLEPKGEARGSPDDGQWEKVIERDFVTGCALLMKRRLIDEIGALDEGFFRYYDDTDMSLRARKAGFKILLVPEAKVWHKVARASGGVYTSPERYWMAHGSVHFFRKHVRGWRWLIVLPYRLASAMKMSIRLMAGLRFAALRAYWAGLWDGLNAR